MKKQTRFLFALFVLGFVVFGNNNVVYADVSVNINIAPPPPLVVHAPPPVVVIPDTYVYFPPGLDVDILFYQGYWYRVHKGHWYRSGIYNGKWVYVKPPKVPVALLHLPSNYRAVPPGHRRIPYTDVKKNWKTWEKEKHWDNHGRGDKPNHWAEQEHSKPGKEHGGPNKGKGKH